MTLADGPSKLIQVGPASSYNLVAYAVLLLLRRLQLAMGSAAATRFGAGSIRQEKPRERRT